MPCSQGRVVVVGSVNADHVFRCERLPGPGETVLALSASVEDGGKGGNQACAAARWGAPTHLVAALGDDADGRAALAALQRFGVDTRRVLIRAGQPTGRAVITVDRRGENSIVVAPGANGSLTAEDVTKALADLGLAGDDVVLSSGEVPDDVVRAVAAAAVRAGSLHVHNLAPASSLPWMAELTGVLVVNEGELSQLSRGADLAAGTELLSRGRRALVVTLGPRGAVLAGADASGLFPAAPSDVIDTTGAGDAFCGVLAAELAQGAGPAVAVAAAVRAGSHAVTAAGARGALASRDQHSL